MRAFTETGSLIVNKARDRFIRHLPLLQTSVLNDIQTHFLTIAESQVSNQLTETELEDIESFVKYSRSYELCIAGVDKWVKLNISSLNDEGDNVFRDVLINVVLHKMDWKSVAKDMSLDGKKQAQTLFKQAVIYLWDKAL